MSIPGQVGYCPACHIGHSGRPYLGKITKKMLGDLQSIKIVDSFHLTPTVYGFRCLFKEFVVHQCYACPYYTGDDGRSLHRIDSGYCEILKTHEGFCYGCTGRIDLQYKYIMEKLRKYLPKIPHLCCGCFNRQNKGVFVTLLKNLQG